MASQKPKARRAEEGPAPPGEWLVTFSDCMTLLLTFFVMLLTFSSFDAVTMKKLSGAFEYETMGSIFPQRRSVPESMMPPADRPSNATEKGSEMPTDVMDKNVQYPKQHPRSLDTDAYRDRKVFYLPAETMFWGNGLLLKEEGKAYLDMLASFLAELPCFVIINESRVGGGEGPGGQAAALERGWRIVQYLQDKHGLAPGDFSIAADGGVVSQERFAGQPVFEFAMVAPRVYR